MNTSILLLSFALATGALAQTQPPGPAPTSQQPPPPVPTPPAAQTPPATVSLPAFDTLLDLDPANLRLGSIDPSTLGLKITSATPPKLHVKGGLDLTFVFGIDSGSEKDAVAIRC